MAGKSTAPAASPETDLSAILARLDAIESEQSNISTRIGELAKTVEDGVLKMEELVAKAAPLSDFETLKEGFEALHQSLDNAAASAGELITGETVEGFDARGQLLTAFRQIEAIANHINVKLPA